MKKILARTVEDAKNNIIRITMYLRPILYSDSDIILGAKGFDSEKYMYDISNPSRIINGPLSDFGEELTPPLAQEWENFIRSCKQQVTDSGFIILEEYRSTDSNKSEYVTMYGLKDHPYGRIIYDLRISDHTLDELKFPEELKTRILEKLKVDKVLAGDATQAGIDFQVEQVLVGSVRNDTWYRASVRLYNLLRLMRNHVQRQIRLHDRQK